MEKNIYAWDAVSLILTDKEKNRADKLINYILLIYYTLGFVFAFFYDTWTIAIGVGSLSLIAFHSAKALLPKSNLYQYVLSVVLGIYMAQFIFQMHGLFEMHFFAFIGSAILIIYQNWRLQIPMLLFVIIHHGLFGYLQNIGHNDIYFTQLGYLELQTFIIHILLAAAIFLICGIWSHELKRYKQLQIKYDQEVAKLQKEAILSSERKRSKDLLQKKNLELEQANKDLAQTNEELDRFVYSVSHDLRAPLTSVLGLIEISQDERASDFVHTNLSLMKTSINKLDNFIKDILNYARSARLEIMTEEIDFTSMIKEVESSCRNMNKTGKVVNTEISINTAVPFVSDKYRLSIIMSNLISNAIRYQSPKNPAPSIKIEVNITEKDSFILIKDNGIGIKKELQGKIFNMFYRASNNSDGTGLGLYIVKQTIEKLNGRIEVVSEPEVGTLFKIWLPNHCYTEKGINLN